ncbi:MULTISPECIES: prepilin peptidase [unclassified Methylobacterium]|uniref:A24 family peptidase n=1 Tax=unclassified Methylobacterium TaxID=2615210 RepID=UPI0006FB7DEF|nr:MULTISPECIES: prepilin peptidase [unclassified Methylobacterium]KQO59872.1 peptidase [Methylobacterium sp. Leaf86]KQO85825.1 peptidase [Methylobacterium sp. Leaf91]
MASVTLLIVFPFLMAYAAVRDLLTMLIPNTVSLLLLAGFALFAVATGLWGWDLMSHLGAGAVTLVVTFTLFALGKIGGGDAKLAAATAVWIGFDRLLEYLAVASLAGGALSLAILMARAHPLPPLLGRLPFALHLHDAKTGVPYGIALSFGALIVIPETMTWARMMAS